MSARTHSEAEISALLIAPDRDLAQKFLATLPQTRAFQIVADLRSYPPHQTLEMRARQLKPAAVLLDLASDPGMAIELVRFLTGLNPFLLVFGVHPSNLPSFPTRRSSEAPPHRLRRGCSGGR